MKTGVIVKLNINTTSAYFTDTILNTWIVDAYKWASGYKPWPFTEGRVQTTYTSTEEWTFEGYRSDSFRMIQVGGKRFDKLNFEDYQIYREDDDQGQDKVFTDFGRIVFVNPNAGVSGTLVAWGQYVPADIDTTDLTATTVFSEGEQEGNNAIVEEVLCYSKLREKNLKDADYHHALAKSILDRIWDRVGDEQYAYKPHRSRGGMFKRFNVVQGGLNDELVKRDQFPFG